MCMFAWSPRLRVCVCACAKRRRGQCVVSSLLAVLSLPSRRLNTTHVPTSLTLPPHSSNLDPEMAAKLTAAYNWMLTAARESTGRQDKLASQVRRIDHVVLSHPILHHPTPCPILVRSLFNDRLVTSRAPADPRARCLLVRLAFSTRASGEW